MKPDSANSLAGKLGIKEGKKIAIINSPTGYIEQLGNDIKVGSTVGEKGANDLVQYFCIRRDGLMEDFPLLKEMLKANGFLWISWPKRSSGVETDLNENVVREIGLANGLVDVKVISIDDTWSALKFVYRPKDRD